MWNVNLTAKVLGSGELVFRPTTGEFWHKAVFKMGPVARPKPTRV